MPYVKSTVRQRLATKNHGPCDAAELNYLICRLIDQYCENVGFKYQTINDIQGALKCVSQEFERRFVGAYEDFKKTDNGEVFVFMEERIKEIKS